MSAPKVERRVCPVCGRSVPVEPSLLGGWRIKWHGPKRGQQSLKVKRLTGVCSGSGTVLPSRQNPKAL